MPDRNEVLKYEYDGEADHLESNDGGPQALVNTITEDTISVPSTYEYEAGEINEEQQEINRGVQEYRSRAAETDKFSTRVNPNASAEISLRGYTVPLTGVQRIAYDNPYRGDCVITVISGGPIQVGLHPGISGQTGVGADTVQVSGSRTMRTKKELWAIATVGGSTAVVDVQEEWG